MNEELLKMRLQFFAEQDDSSDDSGAEEQKSDEQEEKKDKQEEQEEMIPKSQMEQIIKDRVAREKKAAEKKVEEAEKLAKMNQEEKEKYALEKMKKELEEYKKKDQYYALSKEAQKMLSEHDIHADDDLLSIVVKDDAEATKTAVNSFVSLINTKVQEGVKKALQGKPPKVNAQQDKPTKKFSDLSYTEKVELKAKDPQKYNQLKEND